jgi:hypothetical protein
MKYKFLATLLLGLPMMASLTGCSDDDIIFDSELPQFETCADAVLFEVIMPTQTAVDDKIYIVGDFNGGKDEAIKNPEWQLEKAQGNDVKWGVYLNPSDFVDGKTLADGFYFYNASQGEERTVLNQEVVRYDNPSVGTRTNLTVYRWADYFNSPADADEIEHDGYVIYVVDQTGYDDLAMYAWGDAEAFGGWPGIPVTGTVVKDGVTYKYFDTGEDNKDLNLNLIFNNNGGGSQLGDYNVTLNQDYYLLLTADGVSEYDASASVTHDGYAVFVVNKTGWDDIALYMWGDVNDLNGGWPGMQPTGHQTINGVDYLYFDFGEANNGLNENLIFNGKEGSSQLGDFNFTIERDLYLELTTKAVEIDPDTYVPGDTPDVPAATTYNIYVENLSGWDTYAIYAWGAAESFGGWPGKVSSDQDVVTIRGRQFQVFQVEETSSEINLIFNNNGGGTQFDGPAIVVNRDYYFSFTSTACTEISRDSLIYDGAIFVEDTTGWSDLYLYAWGDKEYFGGWPGKAPDGQFTYNGVTYKYWNFSGQGETENLIFNNGDGTQVDGPSVTLDKDYVIKVTASGAQTVSNKSLKNALTKRKLYRR